MNTKLLFEKKKYFFKHIVDAKLNSGDKDKYMLNAVLVLH